MMRLVVVERWREGWLARVYRGRRLLALAGGSWELVRTVALHSAPLKPMCDLNESLHSVSVLSEDSDTTKLVAYTEKHELHADPGKVSSAKQAKKRLGIKPARP